MEIVALIEGLLMPYIISYLAGSEWDRSLKTIFALVASAVVATATVKYNLWFGDTGLNETLLETPAGLKRG